MDGYSTNPAHETKHRGCKCIACQKQESWFALCYRLRRCGAHSPHFSIAFACPEVIIHFRSYAITEHSYLSVHVERHFAAQGVLKGPIS